MAVDQDVVEVVGEVQVGFTGRAWAPHGLSLAGGGGMVAQEMDSVPHSVWLGMHGSTPLLDRIRMKRTPEVVGVYVNWACPPGVPHPSSSKVVKPSATGKAVVPPVMLMVEFQEVADGHMLTVYRFPAHMYIRAYWLPQRSTVKSDGHTAQKVEPTGGKFDV